MNLADAIKNLRRDPTIPDGQTLNKIIELYAVRIYAEVENSIKSAKKAMSGADAAMPEQEIIDMISRSLKGTLAEIKEALLNEVKKAPMPEFVVTKFSFDQPKSEARAEPIPVASESREVRDPNDRIFEIKDQEPRPDMFKEFSHIICLVDTRDPEAADLIGRILTLSSKQ